MPAARLRLPARRKYRNQPTVVDGIRFDSKREAQRWQELRLLEKFGGIGSLVRQPTYQLKVNRVLICKYIADFCYYDRATGRYVVEDAKGVRTREYRIKAKLMRAIYGIEIREV